MHVCFVSREYPPNLMGGIGTYVVNMARVLAQAGHTVSVLTQAHPDVPQRGMSDPVISCEGHLRVYHLPFVDPDWKLYDEARTPPVEALMRRDVVAGFAPIVAEALDVLLRAEKVDVIEAPEYEAPLLHFQQRRASLPVDHPWHGIPCIVHLHSPSHLIFQHNEDPLTGRWVQARKANEGLSITLADGVLSPSAFLAGQVREWLSLPEERVQVIPYPIGPLLEFDAEMEARPGLCLFVGRVEPRKGVFEFVEAAVGAARRHPKARFRFVGGPHYRDGKSGGDETGDLIHAQLPADLRDRFEFAGRVPRHTLGAEYRRAAFTAVPSRWDNYPNTCMEAMSCGRPVLASDQGGMAEMIEAGVSGELAAGPDRATLVHNLGSALDRMLRRKPATLDKMGAAARERILALCDDATIVRRHEEYYTHIAKTTRRDRVIPARGALVLVDDGGAHPWSVARALDAATRLDEVPSRRIIVGQALTENHSVFPRVQDWQVVPGDAEGHVAGLSSLPSRLVDALENVEMVYVGSADDVLEPFAFRKALLWFANVPECGCLACWTRTHSGISAAWRLAPEHLLAPARFPERWFFRMDAVRAAGGLFANGSHLPDLLRDTVLRITGLGWRIGCAGEVLVAPGHRERMPVLRPFAFSERRDSIRAVAQAHGSRAAAAPDLLNERLTPWEE